MGGGLFRISLKWLFRLTGVQINGVRINEGPLYLASYQNCPPNSPKLWSYISTMSLHSNWTCSSSCLQLDYNKCDTEILQGKGANLGYGKGKGGGGVGGTEARAIVSCEAQK